MTGEIWHGVQAPPAEPAPPLRDRVRGREPAGLARPMPDLSVLPQYPGYHDFAEAIANQILDDAMPAHVFDDAAGYNHARRNAIALMQGALHIASQVRDGCPGQDFTSDIYAYERWIAAKFSLRTLQHMRARQLGQPLSTEID